MFGVNDFVTITREPDADWDAIVCAVEDAAAEHLDASAGAPAGDEVAEARKLLRNAVAPPEAPTGRDRPPPTRDESCRRASRSDGRSSRRGSDRLVEPAVEEVERSSRPSP